MHLTSLSLRGFKSFAQATTLALDPGIMCVVGPNGSGKSNIVDALAWVMGEQGAKTLRGGNMSDVIFAGTSSRPALGRAEVKLTIDNSAGELPIDYSEVTISRTLFREGGSEYAINGTPVRLLDIQELLSDTGMGRSMHVIVGQGHLDDILRADPIQRRSFIEEAAGVLKHRRRKERAERKLAGLADKLARVEDLTREIGKQLGPLAKQARIASQAERIQALVRDLEARLLAADATDVTERLARFEAERGEALTQARGLAEEIASLGDSARGLRESLADDAPITEATRSWSRLSTLHDRLASLEEIANERVRVLSAPVAFPAGPSEDEREALLERTRAEVDTLSEALERAELALEERRRGLAWARERESEADEALGIARRDERERERTLAQARLAASQADAASAAAREALQTAVARREESAARVASARAEAPAGEAPLVDDGAHGDYEDAREAARACEERARSARQSVEECAREQAAWQARARALSDMLATFSDPDLAGEEAICGLAGRVEDILNVEGAWADALAHALSPVLKARVAKTATAAKELVTLAQRSDDALVSVVTDCPTPELPRTPLPPRCCWAAHAWHTDDEAVRRVVGAYLTGVVLAADADAARAAITCEGVARVYTSGGHLFAPGLVSAGSQAATTSLSLAHEREEAEARAQVAAESTRKATRDAEQAHDDLARSREREASALTRVREADRQRAEHEADRARRLAQLQAAIEEEQRSCVAEEGARQLLAQREEEAQAARKRLATAEEAAGPGVDLVDLEKRALEARDAARFAQESLASSQLEASAARERLDRTRSRLHSCRRELTAYLAALEQARQREKTNGTKATLAREIAARAGRARQAARWGRDLAEEQRRTAEEERQSSSARLSEIDAVLDKRREAHTRVRDELQRLEVAAAKESLELDHLREQVHDKFGIGIDELCGSYGPHLLVALPSEDPDEPVRHVAFDRRAVARRLARAQRDLKALGKVNPLALEEHKALEERYTFMTDQLADIKRSRADLIRVIREVDAHVESAFAEAFADTSRAFSEVFATLFPGGQGHIELTDPEDMRESGVDIRVRPAGKKISRMSLLSGGERSLAALAFLFAIFKARPSPFYILDEVEAALDDANLTRMLAVFDQLREVSQLIVITHHKRTMEIADSLYGVTMKDGVTTVVGQRMGETKSR